MKRLIDILARDLQVWPEAFEVMHGYMWHSFSMAFYKNPDWINEKVTRAEWQAAVDALNAPKVVEWDKFGFPQAGVTCEFSSNDGYNWKPCRILYADDLSILTGELEGKADRRLLRKCDADVKFRPVRTAEQVAAENRENAAAELFYAVMNHPASSWSHLQEDRKEHYRGLVDGGWKKEPKPCGS